MTNQDKYISNVNEVIDYTSFAKDIKENARFMDSDELGELKGFLKEEYDSRKDANKSTDHKVLSAYRSAVGSVNYWINKRKDFAEKSAEDVLESDNFDSIKFAQLEYMLEQGKVNADEAEMLSGVLNESYNESKFSDVAKKRYESLTSTLKNTYGIDVDEKSETDLLNLDSDTGKQYDDGLAILLDRTISINSADLGTNIMPVKSSDSETFDGKAFSVDSYDVGRDDEIKIVGNTAVVVPTITDDYIKAACDEIDSWKDDAVSNIAKLPGDELVGREIVIEHYLADLRAEFCEDITSQLIESNVIDLDDGRVAVPISDPNVMTLTNVVDDPNASFDSEGWYENGDTNTLPFEVVKETYGTDIAVSNISLHPEDIANLGVIEPGRGYRRIGSKAASFAAMLLAACVVVAPSEIGSFANNTYEHLPPAAEVIETNYHLEKEASAIPIQKKKPKTAKKKSRTSSGEEDSNGYSFCTTIVQENYRETCKK